MKRVSILIFILILSIVGTITASEFGYNARVEVINEFRDLTDTPNNYTGAASNCVTVKNDETGLEFTNCSAGSGGSSTFNITNASLGELRDVDTTGVVNSSIIVYESGTQTWIDKLFSTFGGMFFLNLTGTNAIQDMNVTPFNFLVDQDPTSRSHLTNKRYVDNAVSATAFDFFLTNDTSDITNHFDLIDSGTKDVATTVSSASMGTGIDQEIFNWTTVVGSPGFNELRQGIYDLHIHMNNQIGNKPTTITPQLYNVSSDGSVETLLITFETSGFLTSTGMEYDLHGVLSNEIMISSGDRLTLRLLATVSSGGSDSIVDVEMEGTTDSHLTVETTSQSFSNIFVRQDGTTPLTDQWKVNNNITNITYLGIGIGTPTQLLDVRGNINVSSEIYVQNATAVSPWLYNQTLGIKGSPWVFNSTAIWNDSITGVGIGTDQVFNALDVQGGVAIRSNIHAGASAPANGLFVEGDISLGGVGGLGELDIYEGTPNAQASIRLSSADGGSGSTDGFLLEYVNAVSNWTKFWSYEALPLIFGTYDVEVMRLDTSGVNVSGEIYVQNKTAVSPWLYNQTFRSGWNISGSDVFLGDLSDKVGTGTLSPQTILHVSEDDSVLPFLTGEEQLLISNSGRDAAITIISNSINTAALYFGDVDSAVKGNLMYDHSLDTLSIAANGLTAITFDSSQKVGIGTIIPTQLLDVRGNINVSSEIYVQNGTPISMWMYNQTTSSNFDYNMSDGSYNVTYNQWAYNQSSPYDTYNYNMTNTKFNYNMSDGVGGGAGFWGRNGLNIYNVTASVGIGTISPAYKLDVIGSVNVSTDLHVGTQIFSTQINVGEVDGSYPANINPDGNGDSLYLREQGGSVYGWLFNIDGGNDLKLTNTNTGKGISILDTGNLGVGTFNASHKLTVVGDINVTDNIHGQIDWVYSEGSYDCTVYCNHMDNVITGFNYTCIDFIDSDGGSGDCSDQNLGRCACRQD